MRNALIRRATVVGLVASALVAGGMTSALAAAEPAWPTGSYGSIYLVNGATGVTYAPGTQLAFDEPAGVNSSAINQTEEPTDLEPLNFPVVPGATTFTSFISAPGDESNVQAWKGWSTIYPTNGNAIGLVDMSPAHISNGPQAATIKSAGGTYSLGVAFLSNNSNTVERVYFTAINVDPGVGTWRFATPAAVTEPAVAPAANDTELLTLDAGDVTVAVSGVTATVSLGTSAYDGEQVHVWAYSDAQQLSDATVSAGAITVDVSALSPGVTHYLAVTNSDDELIGYGDFVLDNPNFAQDLEASVETIGEGALSIVAPVDEPSVLSAVAPTAGYEAVSEGTLGVFKVVDERYVSMPGWDVNVVLNDPFVGPDPVNTTTIDKARFGLEPVLVESATGETDPETGELTGDELDIDLGAVQDAGSADWSAGSPFASMDAGQFGTASFDANLSLVAPLRTPAGTYTSTLTVTVVSK